MPEHNQYRPGPIHDSLAKQAMTGSLGEECRTYSHPLAQEEFGFKSFPADASLCRDQGEGGVKSSEA